MSLSVESLRCQSPLKSLMLNQYIWRDFKECSSAPEESSTTHRRTPQHSTPPSKSTSLRSLFLRCYGFSENVCGFNFEILIWGFAGRVGVPVEVMGLMLGKICGKV